MPSERSSLDISSKSTKRNNYEGQCHQQIDNPISNCNNNGIPSTKDHVPTDIFDPMSQIILQDRRHRNLLASKKYRAKKQQKEKEKNEKIQSLTNENQSLQRRLKELEFENKSLKDIMSRITTTSAASILDNNNKSLTVRERLCKNDN